MEDDPIFSDQFPTVSVFADLIWEIGSCLHTVCTAYAGDRMSDLVRGQCAKRAGDGYGESIVPTSVCGRIPDLFTVVDQYSAI